MFHVLLIAKRGRFPYRSFSSRHLRRCYGSESLATMSPLHFNVQEHAVPCQYIREYPGALLHDQEDTLHLHVKQYQPKDQSHKQPGAVTIIGTHANAFPKVSWLL